MDDVEFIIEEILDEDGDNITVCNHPKEIVKIKCPFACDKNSMMRVKVFDIFSEL